MTSCWRTWTVFLVTGLLGCGWLAGCAPVTRSVLVPDAPDAAYHRASIALAQLGGEAVQGNPQARTLGGRVHNAVMLTVTVEAAPAGSRIVVVGAVMPNKIAVGTFDEVDQYIALLRKKE